MSDTQKVADEIVEDFQNEMKRISLENAELVDQLVDEIDRAGAHDDLSDYVADRVADLKDELGAKAANRFEKDDDQEEAMGLVESWVADNVYNAGDPRKDVVLAIYAKGAEEAASDIRAEIDADMIPR